MRALLLTLLLCWPAMLPAAPAGEPVAKDESPAEEEFPAEEAPEEEFADEEFADDADADYLDEDEEDAERYWPEAVEARQQQLAQRPAPPRAPALRQAARRLQAGNSNTATHYADPDWQWRWQWPEREEQKSNADLSWLDRVFEVMREISRWLGLAGHLVLWLALLALLLLLWRFRRQLAGLLPRAGGDERFVAGIDLAPLLKPEALPDDVAAAAWHLWHAGHPRDALSLLYRAALHRLGLRLHFAIPASGTERECLALVAQRADADTTRAFRVLVDGWSRLAWQHRAPADLAPLVDAYRRAAAGADAAQLPANTAGRRA